MSLLNLFRKRTVEKDGAMTRRLILDGTSLAGVTNGGTVRPPDQLQIIERYGQFGRREKIPVTVLFAGKALRELDETGQYRDVTVLNAERREQLPDLLRNALKGQDSTTTIVVTGMPELVAVADSMQITVMRDSTLRKVVERMPGERGASGGRSTRGRGAGGAAKNQSSNSKPEKNAGGSKRDAESTSSGIDDLIDLV